MKACCVCSENLLYFFPELLKKVIFKKWQASNKLQRLGKKSKEE